MQEPLTLVPPKLELILNTTGLVGSVLVLINFIFIAWFKSKLVNRLTLRLQVALSLVNGLLHLHQYFSLESYSEWRRDIIIFTSQYLYSLAICITLLIVLVLHMKILSNKKFDIYYEGQLWVIVLILPLILNIPLYAFKSYSSLGRSISTYNREGVKLHLVSTLTFLLPEYYGFVYCLTIIILVVINIRETHYYSDYISENRIFFQRDTDYFLQKLLKSWVLRLLLYPLAFCLIYSGNLVNSTLYLVSNVHYPGIVYWSITGIRLSGFLNFIAFICDPYYQFAMKTILFTRSSLPPVTSNSSSNDSDMIMDALEYEFLTSNQCHPQLHLLYAAGGEETESLLGDYF